MGQPPLPIDWRRVEFASLAGDMSAFIARVDSIINTQLGWELRAHEATLQFPTPLHAPPTMSFLAWQPAVGIEQTAVMSTQQGFSDRLLALIARHDPTATGLSVRWTPTYTDDAIAEWVYYAHGHRRRIVRAMRDPRWTFWQDGDQLDAEAGITYQDRLIKNRITPELTATIATRLGIPFDQPEFWTTTTTPQLLSREPIPLS